MDILMKKKEITELTLVSREGETLVCDPKIAGLSTFIYNQVEENGDEELIELPNIKMEVLEIVVEFAKLHKFKPPTV